MYCGCQVFQCTLIGVFFYLSTVFWRYNSRHLIGRLNSTLLSYWLIVKNPELSLAGCSSVHRDWHIAQPLTLIGWQVVSWANKRPVSRQPHYRHQLFGGGGDYHYFTEFSLQTFFLLYTSHTTLVSLAASVLKGEWPKLFSLSVMLSESMHQAKICQLTGITILSRGSDSMWY